MVLMSSLKEAQIPIGANQDGCRTTQFTVVLLHTRVYEAYVVPMAGALHCLANPCFVYYSPPCLAAARKPGPPAVPRVGGGRAGLQPNITLKL